MSEDPKPQITQIAQMSEGEDRSGHDLDTWGGEVTTPVLIPTPGEYCVELDEEGRCPPGCRECFKFAEEMQINHESHEGHE